jgi:hypothetical protein
MLDVKDGGAVAHTAERTDIFEILATATVSDDAKPARQDVLNMRTHSTVESSMVVSFVELRGFEPLTPTLPGAGRGREQAVQQ